MSLEILESIEASAQSGEICFNNVVDELAHLNEIIAKGKYPDNDGLPEQDQLY